jgi:hypothetical protein
LLQRRRSPLVGRWISCDFEQSLAISDILNFCWRIADEDGRTSRLITEPDSQCSSVGERRFVGEDTAAGEPIAVGGADTVKLDGAGRRGGIGVGGLPSEAFRLLCLFSVDCVLR